MEKNVRIQKEALLLINAHRKGLLGGEKMPEDENPQYEIGSKENYLYFTLPMALNYQRNSYTLWESAKATAIDEETKDIFIPKKVIKMSKGELQEKMLKYKVALQPNKQPEIWWRLCETFEENFSGDVRSFFETEAYSVEKIQAYMLANKKKFPYLSGNKISNYWLYVMSQYTDAIFSDREQISVAPDTHIVKASLKLGILNEEEYKAANVQVLVAQRWQIIMTESGYDVIDVHTPLWLWSRNNFNKID